MDYLNRPDVRKLLGAESPGNFTSCSDDVFNRFVERKDRIRVQTQLYVGQLLEVKSIHRGSLAAGLTHVHRH